MILNKTNRIVEISGKHLIILCYILHFTGKLLGALDSQAKKNVFYATILIETSTLKMLKIENS